jgi:hypothetical protein
MSANPVAQARRKRTFEEEMEDDMDAFFNEEEDDLGSVPAGRTIAKPRSSVRRAVSDGIMLDGGGGDFEDAAFLAPMDVDDD